MAMSGNGQNIGRLWVAIDADTKDLTLKLKEASDKMDEFVKQTKSIGTGTSGMDKVANDANRAAESIDRTARAQKRAMRPTTALNYTMLRLSQAFVNLRYGNPLGVIAGLAQAGASASRGVSGLLASVGGLKGGLTALLGSVTAVIGGLAALAAIAATAAVAVAGVIIGGGALIAKIGVKAAADLETLKIQYEAMLGSARAAQDEVNYLLELGKTSVVPTEQLLEANRQLLAYGITDQKLRRDLIGFVSDYGSAAGLSAGQVGNLSYAIGQISAQGRALTQDVRQLSNASIGVDKLAAALGITVEEFNKMTAAGEMTADVILPAIIAQAENLGPAAEKARESFNGIMNNLGDIAKINIASAFEGILQKIKPAIKWVEEFITAFDFQPIADAISGVMDFFAENVFNGMVDASESGRSFSENFAKVIGVAGQVMGVFVNIVRIAVAQAQILLQSLVIILQTVFGALVDLVRSAASSLSILAGIVGLDGVAEGLNNFANGAANLLKTVEGSIAGSATNIKEDFGSMEDASLDLVKSLLALDFTYNRVARGSGSSAGEFSAAVEGALGGGGGDGDGDGAGGSGKNPLFDIWKTWIKELDKVIDQYRSSRDTIKGLLTDEFGGEGTLIKALTFGSEADNFQADADKIISSFDKTASAVSDYFNAVGGGENRIFGKQAFKAARNQKNALLGTLRAQTAELVRLARENEALEKELGEFRKDEVARLEKQLDATERVYQGFIGADGYFVKGSIQVANEAYAAAQKAYSDANAKLQDLLAERDQFLNGIRDTARSFVNALTVDAEMVSEFRRIDDVGSFAQTEKKKTESIKEQMRERLAALKKWAADLQTLRQKGLNEDLLRDLISAGPEAAGEAASELANAGQDSISEINDIQNELNSVIGGVQGQANDMFFASAISAQQNLVNGLAAQQEAARVAAEAAEAEYQRSRMALEAQIRAVEEGTDDHSKALKQQMEDNAEAAAKVTASVTKSLSWINDKDNPFNPKKTGKNAINGLIEGLEAKRPALIRKARNIADEVSRTIASALDINSPSKLMMQYGAWVGEGLALGMDSSLSKVEAASVRMAGVSVPDLGSGESVAPTVKVYVGNTELKEIVDVQIEGASARDLNTVLAGRRN